MKRNIAILLTALLVCLLLIGCTPKDAKPTENGTSPTLDTDYLPSPEGTPAPENKGDEGVSASELDEQMESEDEGGLEVEDNYEVEVGEDAGVGVGGN